MRVQQRTPYSPWVHISLGRVKAAQVTGSVLRSERRDFTLRWAQGEFWMTDDCSAVQFHYLLLIISPVLSTS